MRGPRIPQRRIGLPGKPYLPNEYGCPYELPNPASAKELGLKPWRPA